MSEVIVSTGLFVIGLIFGFRLGLEKALKDPHYAEGFIDGFSLKAVWALLTGKDATDG